ncbi:MAG: DNA cytosine methyltransferase [Oscillatoriaceae cyanobacterium Prado104]|jgi:DNA (cytosine-5)-methyltransferase 1|nr:DNA cytosine methyltransferase [Oscillatoriaceae cyanobacterium Prado104]
MEAIQLSLFSNESETTPPKKQKQAKLGRYDRIQRQLETENCNPYKIFIDVESQSLPASDYTFVDLFCGAGGMTQGLLQAGLRPLASVEINEIASATHRKNFPDCHHVCSDIKDFKSQDLLAEIGSPEVHLVAGGPPCQGFSVAGKRDPNDPRNRLFREFVRVVSEMRPWYVVMENVPGILTMQKGFVKQAICEAFQEIGYPNMSVAILESATYGVPQIRPRAIFIANRFGMQNPYPKSQLLPEQYKAIESAIADLPEYTPIPEINHEWTRHSAKYMERIAKVPPGGSLYETYADAFKRQYPGKPSMTVKENHGGTHIHPYLDRVISAREMARLQTFPDSFIFEGSMKKAMWQIGNAVPPRLAECIGLALIPYLSDIALNTASKVNNFPFPKA